jgi:hypothetical protein
MTDAELIARLRLLNEVDANVAADRIEALATALRLVQTDGLHIKHARRAERLEAALRKIDVGEGWAAQIAREALK